METKKIIVVGSGLSGLTAAALLAKKGLDVLVLEKSDRPGGSCSAFRRKDVTFDLGAAMLYGFGERGFNPHRWVMAELEENLDVYRHEALYKLNYGEDPIVFWPEIERFVGELTAIFPGSEDEIRGFYRYIMDLYDKVIGQVLVFEAPTEMKPDEMRRRFLADPRRQLTMIALLFKSAESMMRRRVTSPDVRRFFDKLTSTYCYTTLRETPAILAATMFSDNHIGGSYYPAGSPMVLSARLEKAVEKFGGEIRYGAEVVRIRRLNDGSLSLVLSSGVECGADAILFAGAVRNLASRIAEPGLLPPRWSKKVTCMEMSWPSFVVYGTLDAALCPKGLMPIEMFIDNKEALDEGDVTLYVSALEDPSLAPQGILPFTLIGPSLRTWPVPGSKADGSPEYATMKKNEIDRMIDAVDRRAKGFAAAVLTVFGGSPTTIERYLGKPGGSVAGPKQRMGQHMMLRPRAHSPAKGLYLCGESTVMGTGTPAVTVSGISAANAMLRDLGLGDYSTRGDIGNAVRIIPSGTRGNEPSTEVGKLARLCQWCERPPCRAACPASLDIPGLMRRLETGNDQGARNLAKAANPPCATCTVQNGDPLCEKVCLRGDFAKEAVPIARIVAASLVVTS